MRLALAVAVTVVATWAVVGVHQTSGATSTTYGSGTYVITVPSGVTQMTFDLYGAQGASLFNTGGLGGRTAATIDVTPGATLQLRVGGAGDNETSPGFNGGGAGVRPKAAAMVAARPMSG